MDFVTKEPIAWNAELGVPILYPALGVSLHLEPLTPDHQDPLAQASALVLDWIGSELRWTHNSAFPVIEPFRPIDLSYAQGFTRLLDTRLEDLPPEVHVAAINVRASLVADFSLDCHGGTEAAAASPFQYRFFGTLGDEQNVRDILPTRAMVRVLVPTTWPLEDFRKRAVSLARVLPVRWGNAGLTYAGWELNWYQQVRNAVFAHARRYPGYDMGQYATLMDEFHAAMRTVSWLNFLGPDFRARLERAGARLASSTALAVDHEGSLTLVQAGVSPESGDTNRLRPPSAYLEADAMLRPVRHQGGISFLNPWSEASTDAWILRFERHWT